MALLGGTVITLTGCGGGGGPAAPTAAPSPTGPANAQQDTTGRHGEVSANHGHAAVLTAAHFSSDGGVTLDIRGEADHTHTVQLTSVEVDLIEAGQQVSKSTSTTDAHFHTVTFSSADPMPDDY